MQKVLKRSEGSNIPSLHFTMVDLNYIESLLAKHLQDKAYFLVDLKLSPSKIAVFIDTQSGVTVEECSALHHWLFKELEPTGFTDKGEIEVSSPGLEKPLKVPLQYLKNKGRKLKVTTSEGKILTGILLNASDNDFQLALNEKNNKAQPENILTFRHSDIKQAVIQF